ncbi:MAG TPA: glycogen debranching protein GlgX [Myxococcales bacterium LLY-WYZ-16_1]|nr:glycogen debranching protein GlgX [Myxococcales bacterium LLY-WYZ-16_1]
MNRRFMDLRPGVPHPLGAHYDGSGTNFAVASSVADRVWLCRFDPDGREDRSLLPGRTGSVFHGYAPDLHPGTRYGFRVRGPYDPELGHRCNPHKLLLDPYARCLDGRVRWNEALFSYRFDDPDGPVNTQDSAPFMPKARVVDPFFDWGLDRPPRTSWADTVIYELHVKGFTARHPGLPAELRGTYAGLAHPAVVEHLVQLGITAVELLPVHAFVHPANLLEKGLRNYWGYDSIGYFAPHAEYSRSRRAGGEVNEFKQMVKDLHAAGIEVLLDVVYNHTAEGNHLGPTLCFRGLDNHMYYRTVEGQARYYMDYTGCGNSLDTRSPFVLQLIMDSLRYWVEEMHVDGFRFDLATVLAREEHHFDLGAGFFDIVQQDPVLRQTKLIAEPWDVGEGGYQVGGFPTYWSEWNGAFRDHVRDFWRGQEGTLGLFAKRLTGSADLYEHAHRPPQASINFVTAHDGFTLRDLVSYNHRHNEANGEDNQDGDEHNRSWNCGVEGDTEDADVLALRSQQSRNFIATLLLSHGVPMLLAGDEMGRTQGGNNNAYCQDNEVSWVDWSAKDEALLAFTQQLLELRRRNPAFRRPTWFHPGLSRSHPDIEWYRSDGQPMEPDDWELPYAKSVAVFMSGESAEDSKEWTEPGRSFLLLINASHEDVLFTIPNVLDRWGWTQILDTSAKHREFKRRSMRRRRHLECHARSMTLLASAT